MVAEVSNEITLKWMPEDFIDDKSTLVQVIALCPQAQAITCNNVYPVPCRHMASLGHNELYGPCMIVSQKWTKICWLATAN